MDARWASLVSWLPATIAAGGIFYMSAQPGDDLDLPTFFMADKLLHAVAYFLLGTAVHIRIILRSRLTGLPLNDGKDYPGLLFALIYAVSDEIHQLFVPSRQFSLGDIAADFLGAFLAWRLYVWWASRSPVQAS